MKIGIARHINSSSPWGRLGGALGDFNSSSPWGRLGGALGALLVTFILQKLYFLALTWHEGTTAADVLDVVCHGLLLDVAVCAYALTVPWLLLFTDVIIRLVIGCRQSAKVYGVPHLSALLRGWWLLLSVVFAVIIVADASLYPFWQFKLDASVFLYTDKPADALASVSTGYVISRVIWVVVWLYLQWRLARMLRVFRGGTDAPVSNTQRWLAPFFLLVIGGVLVLAIRGGLGKGTNNVSVAYYSDNQYLNHAAVNPVFNLLYSLGKQENFGSEAQFFTPDEAEAIAASIYKNNGAAVHSGVSPVGAVPNGAVLNSALKTPLLRTQRPDILLIIWEGGCWNILRTLKAGPALTALADDAIDFSNCYANSFRTDRGQLSLLSGWPAIPKTSLMKIPEKCDHLPALPRTLLDNGYATTFWYGGDITFANTGGYMHQAGFQRCVSDKDFPRSQRATSWGVYDGTLFDRMADDMISQHTKGRSAFNCIMTLSSHEPWTVPGRRFTDDRLNAFAYTDECIARLLTRLRKSPLWDNLLVIITSDHGVRLDESMPLSDPSVTHIPMLWTGGAIVAPQRITPLMNQSDLAATLLSQMGIDSGAFFFSRDVLSPQYVRPSAFHTYNGGISFVDATGYTTYDLDGGRATLNPDPQRERKAKGILQYLYLKIQEL